MDRVYVALDLELTGLDTLRDGIIEIAMVKFRGQEVLDTFTSLVRPERSIPLKIQQLVGIAPNELDKAPTLASLRGRISGLAANYPIVAHSVAVDQQFLNRQGLLLTNPAVDTFELAGIVLPAAGRYTLANLAEITGMPLDQNHRALPDALATKDLFLYLLERIRAWDDRLLDEVVNLAAGSDWPLAPLFQDVLAEKRGVEGPLFSQSTARTRPQARKSGLEDDLPPLQPRDEIKPLDPDELAALIGPDGPFAQAFEGYEYRPQQLEMVRAVAEAFNLPSHLLVEAGTGTGKSLAYLLPAIQFALENEQRVLVSSNTINLQDQLYNKDLPDIRRVLSLPFRVALLKGRNNYLCLRRLELLRRSRQLDEREIPTLVKILAWLRETNSGDRSELLLVNSDWDIWSQVQSTPETCLGDQCPHRRQGNCFFYRARSRAERAHLVLVNHALLLSDLVLENRILPDYRYVIIDEAHHLEDVATDQFSLSIGRQDLYAYLNSISHQAGDAPAGLLGRVPGIFRGDGVGDELRRAVASSVETLSGLVELAQQRLYYLFQAIDAFARTQGLQIRGPYEQSISLTSGLRAQPDWSEIEIAWDDLAAPLNQLLEGLEHLLSQAGRLPRDTDDEDAEREETIQEVTTHVQQGRTLCYGLERILTAPEDGDVYWISISPTDSEISLHSAPLHVGPLLKERLFDDKDCVVLTSATLRTSGSFHYIESRLGIEDALEVALDSPFDFKSAVLLYVPKDIPEPNEPHYQKTVEQAIVDLCQATEGRTMVLFTSNSQLHATYRAVQRPLEEAGIVVFGQGQDGSRQQILERFRNTPRSVLMGTRSFWEGVDIAGEALSCLVIAKLPFAVPTDPVLAARAQTFERPFDEYYLPDAILRFRQGFGRLIRSKDDYGLVVVLDKRILTKAYGKTMLRSLPGCTARQGPLSALPQLAQRWLDPSNRA